MDGATVGRVVLRASTLVFVIASMGCWPAVPDGWEPDRGEAVVRVRAHEGDVYVKLKEGLARTLYEELEGAERCAAPEHCRVRGEQLICSAENLRDPYVCQLHLTDGAWMAPRDDFELYHSLEANRRYGEASLDEGVLVIDGDAGEVLAAELGVDAPVVLSLDVGSGAVGGGAE